MITLNNHLDHNACMEDKDLTTRTINAEALIQSAKIEATTSIANISYSLYPSFKISLKK